MSTGLPPQLETDLNYLREQGFQITCQRNSNTIYIIFDCYPLPRGWNKKETKLLLISDISYPNSKIDMFWVDTDVLLADGKVPQAGESIENHNGQTWRRFSWHVKKWNPAVDSVITYLGTVDARLNQLQ